MTFAGFLFAQAAIASAELPPEDLLAVELFEEACIGGKVTSDEFHLEPAKFHDLPMQGFGRFYDERKIAQVFRLETATRPAFLVFFERDDAKGTQYRQGCGIVQKGLDLTKSFAWLLQRIGFQLEANGHQIAQDTYHFQFDPPVANASYFIEAIKMADQSTIIRILYRNPEQIAEFLEAQEQNR